VTFEETSYGIVKRLRTVERWAVRVANELDKPALSILDFGCGTGDHLTEPLASLGHRVLGVDCHEASIVEAQRRYVRPNLSFRLAELETLVHEGMLFDMIVCSEVLEHLYDPAKFLMNLRRLMAEGGGLIITTPNGYGAFEWLSSLERGLNRVGIHGMLRNTYRVFWKSRGGYGAAKDRSDGGGIQQPIGFLNVDSRHVQFFTLGALNLHFAQARLRVVEKRARTLLCGPYVDILFRWLSWWGGVYRLNNSLADMLPMSWAADWMFLLQSDEQSGV